jgi:hypothetical protein
MSCQYIDVCIPGCNAVWTFGPEDEASMFLRNVSIFLQVHTALQPRRPTPTMLYSPRNSLRLSSSRFLSNHCSR